MKEAPETEAKLPQYPTKHELASALAEVALKVGIGSAAIRIASTQKQVRNKERMQRMHTQHQTTTSLSANGQLF